MKKIWMKNAVIALVTVLAAAAQPNDKNDEALLKVRESVWRAWFANDEKLLHELVPPETLVLSAHQREWKNQADVFREAAKFHASGGRLLQLEFARTEIRHFGDVAIVYGSYSLETEMAGKREKEAGRVTEIFVRRNGKWTNPGWHTDAEQP